LLGFWAMIGKSNAVLLALLLALPTAFMATAFIAPAVGQTNYSAWLKIVTDSWDGVPTSRSPTSQTHWGRLSR
jgi:ABC-type phosphate transport system permease subunit